MNGIDAPGSGPGPPAMWFFLTAHRYIMKSAFELYAFDYLSSL